MTYRTPRDRALPRHPAPYSDALLPILAEYLPTGPTMILVSVALPTPRSTVPLPLTPLPNSMVIST